MADLHRFGVCSYLLKNDLKQAIYELLQVGEHIFGIMNKQVWSLNYFGLELWPRGVRWHLLLMVGHLCWLRHYYQHFVVEFKISAFREVPFLIIIRLWFL